MAKKSTKKTRVAVPAKTKTAVLKEFNHRCAICGTDNPQIHHLDEDPSNNDPQNLLPLCPNCHLLDQHNPTARIDARKLQLFRRFKDPVILSPKFEPLFRRMLFADEPHKYSLTELRRRIRSLVAFVKCLEMGNFYSAEIHRLCRAKHEPTTLSNMKSPGYREENEQLRNRETVQHLRDCRDELFELCVELLRYQTWEPLAGS